MTMQRSANADVCVNIIIVYSFVSNKLSKLQWIAFYEVLKHLKHDSKALGLDGEVALLLDSITTLNPHTFSYFCIVWAQRHFNWFDCKLSDFGLLLTFYSSFFFIQVGTVALP